jgi:hypothetical protein
MAASGMEWTGAVVAFILALPLWRFSRHAITLAHEGGHALIGLLTGGKFLKEKIHLNRDGSGATHIKTSGLSSVLTGLAGYLGPSAVGFAGAQMLVHDFDPQSVLVLSLVFAIFVLILTRNAFGLVVALSTVGLLWFAVTRAEPGLQLGVAYVWVWFLLMGSTRMIPHLYYGMLRQKGDSDAEQLQSVTHIGDVVWLFVFWLGTMAALVYGGAMLLRHHG